MSAHDSQHRPEDEPFDCALASLQELAGAKVDRRRVLEHGERALYALKNTLDDARDEAAGWHDHADQYARLLFGLAGRGSADATLHDPLVAASDVRRRLDELARDNGLLREAIEDAAGHVDEARRYARWFRNMGAGEPAVDILRELHGIPAWLGAVGAVVR